jgi:hypothetical protein
MNRMNQDNLSKYQLKRLNKVITKFKGKSVFLNGTENTTQVKGVITNIRYSKPKKYMKISYGILFEDQDNPIFGPRKSFVLV